MKKWNWKMRTIRHGTSRIEVLVILAILTVLIGLLLPAVQNVRLASYKLSATNRMRQITLATLNATGDRQSVLPSVVPVQEFERQTLFDFIRPYLEQDYGISLRATAMRSGSGEEISFEMTRVWVYENPADPSFQEPVSALQNNSGTASFVANDQVFRNPTKLSLITDGTSNTIAIAERFSRCGRVRTE
jgi:type II secretory pathway pseudopilin PulG